jgi:hypothetical protein
MIMALVEEAPQPVNWACAGAAAREAAEARPATSALLKSVLFMLEDEMSTTAGKPDRLDGSKVAEIAHSSSEQERISASLVIPLVRKCLGTGFLGVISC